MRAGRVGWLLFVAIVFAGSVSARADEDTPEKSQARLLLAQGNALFEKGDLRGAVVDFRAAYALYPSPKLLVNAAACERELGDAPAAANDLRHYLDDSPGDDPFLDDKARTDLRALEKRLGRIALAGWPPKSTLEVDGRPAREVDYVRPGAHHVHARAADAPLEVEREVSVAAGEQVTLHAPALPFAATTAPPQAPPRVHKKSRWWIGLVVGGVALVAAGVGVGVGLTYGKSTQPLHSDLGIYKFSDFK
jgi:hypothetical protein